MKEAKEKADKLVRKFQAHSHDTDDSEYHSKECALILVEEMIDALPTLVAGDGYGSARFSNPQIKFWQEVKSELEK